MLPCRQTHIQHSQRSRFWHPPQQPQRAVGCYCPRHMRRVSPSPQLAAPSSLAVDLGAAQTTHTIAAAAAAAPAAAAALTATVTATAACTPVSVSVRARPAISTRGFKPPRAADPQPPPPQPHSFNSTSTTAGSLTHRPGVFASDRISSTSSGSDRDRSVSAASLSLSARAALASEPATQSQAASGTLLDAWTRSGGSNTRTDTQTSAADVAERHDSMSGGGGGGGGADLSLLRRFLAFVNDGEGLDGPTAGIHSDAVRKNLELTTCFCVFRSDATQPVVIVSTVHRAKGLSGLLVPSVSPFCLPYVLISRFNSIYSAWNDGVFLLRVATRTRSAALRTLRVRAMDRLFITYVHTLPLLCEQCYVFVVLCVHCIGV